MSRIGIFGGTFNPIHNGHLKLAAYCRDSLNLDSVILIPDYTPPHKSGSELVSGDDRLEMCRLAAAGLDGLTVSDIELRRGGTSYTFKTLSSLKELYPGDELFLIMGADMFLTLPSWKNPDIIFEKASIIAVPRDGDDNRVLLDFYEETLKNMGARVFVLEKPVMQVSSTFVRSNICNRELVSEYLPGAVYDHIAKKGLYGFRDYAAIIRGLMGDYRYIHSVNVAREAVELARLYGSDTGKAYIAGMIHDITKEIPKDEQLQIIADGGIILDDVQKNAPKLWHSISGSVYIRRELGITGEDMINAVRYHTTGRAGMSLLEKIIYIADFTAEGRSYNGVEIMRERSRQSLEAAMLFSCQFFLQELSKKELAIHPDQLGLYNELVMKG